MIRRGHCGRAAAAVGLALGAGCAELQPPSPEAVFEPLAKNAAVAVLPAPALSGPLTLEAAVRRALENSPQVADARAAADAAREAARAAGDLRDPELRFGFGQSDSDSTQTTDNRSSEQLILPPDYYSVLYPPQVKDVVPGSADRLALVQPRKEYEGTTTGQSQSRRVSESEGSFQTIALRVFPPNLWARSAAMAGGRARQFAAEAEWMETRRQAETAMRRAFAEGAFAEREAAALERKLALQKQWVAIVHEGVNANRLPRQDLLVCSRPYLETLSARDEIRRQLERLRRQIAADTRLPEPGLAIAFSAPDVPERLPDAWSEQRLILAALGSRGDLAALYWRAQVVRSAWREAVAQQMPWFTYVQGGYSWSDDEQTASETGTSESRTPHLITDPDLTRTGGQYLYTERHSGEDARTGAQDGDSHQWRIDAGIQLPIFTWMGNTTKARRYEYQHARLAADAAQAKMREDVAAALEEARSLARIRAEYRAESEPVLREMKSALADAQGNRDLLPEDRVRMELQVLESEQLQNRYDRESALALLTLQDRVGGTLPAGRPAAE